jgi:hypothetical protein
VFDRHNPVGRMSLIVRAHRTLAMLLAEAAALETRTVEREAVPRTTLAARSVRRS